MSVLTRAEIQAMADLIGGETAKRANTPQRVGDCLRAIADSMMLIGDGISDVDVKVAGAVGDGVTDDSAAFAAADLVAAASGGKVFVPMGTYNVPTFALSSGVTLEGEGDVSVLLNCYLTCTGTAGAEIPFTAPAAKGATAISIPATGLDGAWLRLASVINMQSTDAGADQLGHEAAADGFFAEFKQVLVGAAGSATLSGGTVWAYSNTPGGDSGSFTTSVARVVTFHAGSRIRSIKFLGKNTSANYVIRAQWCRDLLIEGVSIDSNDVTAILAQMDYCLDSHIVGGRYTGKRTTVPAGALANQIRFLSCQGCTIKRATTYYGNQSVDIDCVASDATYRGGPSINCGASDCQAFDCATDGFTSHWGNFGSFFDNCRVSGSPRGIRVRDRGAKARGCTVLSGVTASGIGILIDEAAFYDAEVVGNTVSGYLYGISQTHSSAGYETLQGLLGCGSAIIARNTVRGTGSHGIFLEDAYTAATLCGPRVEDNEINSPTDDGIHVGSYFNGTVVHGNRINGIGSGDAGIQWDANIKRLHIGPNHIYGVDAAGFAVVGAGLASFMTDATTFPGGESEAQLFVAEQYTDAASAFASVIRDVTAYAAARVQGWGPFVGKMGTSAPTSERQTFGFYLSGSQLRVDTRDSANSLVTSMVVMRGAGTPEGAVTSGVGGLYIDTATGILYAKTSGTGNTGWVKVSAT